jgi:hypothetical protein
MIERTTFVRTAGQIVRILAYGLCVAALLTFTPAHGAGRVVGILFDDSGSMAGRLNLPAFGAQVLVSSLDGVVGQDSLYTIRLSVFEKEVSKETSRVGRIVRAQRSFSPEYIRSLLETQTEAMPRKEEIQTQESQQKTIQLIREQWPVLQHATPYEPLEILLEQLARAAKPDQDVFLVILTDGEFDRENLPGPDKYPPEEEYLRRIYSNYEARFSGRLRVEYLLISDMGTKGIRLRKSVETQKVRETLLSVFNKSASVPGVPMDGEHNVSSVPELVGAIQTIIARISATDRSDKSEVAKPLGKSIHIQSPFSVSRLISIANGPVTEGAPNITSNNFNRAPDLRLESRMDNADDRSGWANQRQMAITSHFRFDPPRSAESEIVLNFDKDPSKNVLLLFQTEARYELRVRDSSGELVATNADGSVNLVERRGYTVEGVLVDYNPSGTGVRDVPFASLPQSAKFSAFVAGAPPPSGAAPRRSAIDLRRNDPKDRAAGVLAIPAAGDYNLTGEFNLPGFVSKSAAARKLHVQSGSVGYSVDVRAEKPCTGCAADELRVTARQLREDRKLATVHIEQLQGVASEGRLTLQAPPNVVLADREGKAIGRSIDVNLSPGSGLDLQLRLTEDFNPGPGKTSNDVGLSLTANEPFSGRAAAQRRLVVDIPDVKLHYVGNSRDSPLDKAFVTSGESLNKGADFLRFRAENLPSDVRPEDLQIVGASRLLQLERRDGADGIELVPRQRWCTCLTWAFGVPNAVGLEYVGSPGYRPAATHAAFAFAPTLWELGMSCGAILLVLLALTWAIAAAYLYFTAFRFPRGSHLEISRANSPVPESEPLRGSEGRLLLAALFLRRANEQTSVRGLYLEARPSGAVLKFRDSDPDIRLIDQATFVRDVLKNNPQLLVQFFPWGSRFGRSRTERLMVIRSG